MSIQLKFKIKQHGGKRKGAGRPNLSKTVNHMKRPKVDFTKPLHITLKLSEQVPNIRRPATLRLFKQAIQNAGKFDLHVLHFSIQTNHIHMIVEAKHNTALSKGMQSLTSSFAKTLKKSMREWDEQLELEGPLFQGRYHLSTIQNPTQMKNTLKYVLLNKAKHEKMIPHMDTYSSARAFTHWKELLGPDFKHVIDFEARAKPLDLNLAKPQSWLAREGWRRSAR